MKQTRKLKSYEIRQCLEQKFPLNKNVTKHHACNMKRKVKPTITSISNVQCFKEFEDLCNASNLDLGLDNAPITDDNVVEVVNEVWEELTSNASCNDNVIFTFQEFMEFLKQSNSGFRHVVLRESIGKFTGSMW